MKSIAFDTSLEFLFKTHFRKLVYFSYQIVANKENAEDIVQEVFLKYCNRRDEINPDGIATSEYLFTAVKNASLNSIRNKKVGDKFKAKYLISEVDEGSMATAMMEAEIISELYTAIQSLPAGCKEITRLGFLEEKKNQEIADELGISITTVKSQKQRALQLLRLRVSPDIFGLFLIILLK